MQSHFQRLIVVLGAVLLALLSAYTGRASTPSDTTSEAARAERPAVLAMVFRVGEVDRFVTELDVEERKTVFNQTTSQRIVQRAEISVTVEEVSERGSRVTVILERVAFEAKGSPLNGVFDSRDPVDRDPGNLFAESMRPIVDVPLSVNLSPDRTIQRISGMRNLVPGDERASLLFESFFSEDSLKNMLQPLFRAKSDPTSARVGEQWTVSTMDQTDFGILRRNIEHTLESLQDGIARISIGGDLSVTDTMPGNPAATRVESSSIEGTCLWNTRVGRLDRFTSESQAVMKAGDEEFAFTSELRSRVRIVHAPK